MVTENGSQRVHVCPCSVCQRYSRAYLHHLLKARELLAYQFISIHNVMFMNRLLWRIRKAIKEDQLDLEHQRWVIETSQHSKLLTELAVDIL